MQLDKVFLKLIWEQPDNYKQKKKKNNFEGKGQCR